MAENFHQHQMIRLQNPIRRQTILPQKDVYKRQGIHTINDPRVYKPTAEQFIGQSDVTSMYPSLAIINHWLPVHLGEDFWNVYSALYKAVSYTHLDVYKRQQLYHS